MARNRSFLYGNTDLIDSATKKAFEVEGLSEILGNISKIVDKAVGAEAKSVYLKAGIVLRDRARANARVKTGRLRESIFVARGDENKANVLVGVNYRIAPHAHLVEYGTKNMAARPYLRPAITMTGQEIGRMIREGLLKIIENYQK